MKPQQLITPKLCRKKPTSTPGSSGIHQDLPRCCPYYHKQESIWDFTEEQTGSVCLAEPGGGGESIPWPWVSQTSLDTHIRPLLFSLGPWDLQLLSSIKEFCLFERNNPDNKAGTGSRSKEKRRKSEASERGWCQTQDCKGASDYPAVPSTHNWLPQILNMEISMTHKLWASAAVRGKRCFKNEVQG